MPVFPANAALMSSTAFLSDAAAKTVTVFSCATAWGAPVNATATDAAAAIMKTTEFIGMAVLRRRHPHGRRVTTFCLWIKDRRRTIVPGVERRAYGVPGVAKPHDNKSCGER